MSEKKTKRGRSQAGPESKRKGGKAKNSTTASSSRTVTYTEEIAKIMTVNGDARLPDPGSVSLIEGAVKNYLMTLLRKLFQVSSERGTKISLVDVSYVLRSNPGLLERVGLYMYYKEEYLGKWKGKAKAVLMKKPALEPSRKRLRTCTNFVSTLEETTLDTIARSVSDPVLRHRLKLADVLSRDMSMKEYVEFTTLREVGFTSPSKPDSKKKFSQWIGGSLAKSIPEDVLDVLSYLAYEKVIEILESALMIQWEVERATALIQVKEEEERAKEERKKGKDKEKETEPEKEGETEVVEQEVMQHSQESMEVDSVGMKPVVVEEVTRAPSTPTSPFAASAQPAKYPTTPELEGVSLTSEAPQTPSMAMNPPKQKPQKKRIATVEREKEEAEEKAKREANYRKALLEPSVVDGKIIPFPIRIADRKPVHAEYVREALIQYQVDNAAYAMTPESVHMGF